MAAIPPWMSVLLYQCVAAAVLFGAVGGAEQQQASGDSLTTDDSFGGDNNNDNDNKTSLWIGVGGGIAALVVAIVLFIIITVAFVRLIVKRKSKSQPIDERIAEIDIERENAMKAVTYYLRKTRHYSEEDHRSCPPELPDMGSRMQKYWFRLTESDDDSPGPVLTIAPIPKTCPLLTEQVTEAITTTGSEQTSEKKLEKEMLENLKMFMMKLREAQHPFLHPIEEIGYLDDRKQVIIIQPYMPSGSLKDLIYGATPDLDWAKKYPAGASNTKIESKLTTEDIAKYGWQVLKAMVFLYKQGFPVLGHVQSGNIFVQNGVCRLGGYENTLLGYRSRFYRMCQDHLEHMDVIMFGHLVFEMSCAYELTTVFPTVQDYEAVKARDGRLEEVLRYIFDNGIDVIKKHEFFKSAKSGIDKKYKVMQFFRKLLPADTAKAKILKAVREAREDDEANYHAEPKQKRPQSTPLFTEPSSETEIV